VPRERIQAAFLAAAAALRSETGSHELEICAVLDRLPSSAVLGAADAELIDHVDAVMDALFRAGRLTCPGHRWLSEPVSSIRHHLTALFEQGHVRRDPGGRWGYQGVTSYFVLVEPWMTRFARP
jgi:DNA-binding transcriptional ArsR family regulator